LSLETQEGETSIRADLSARIGRECWQKMLRWMTLAGPGQRGIQKVTQTGND
jgi:hypothetical protein